MIYGLIIFEGFEQSFKEFKHLYDTACIICNEGIINLIHLYFEKRFIN